MLLKVSTVFHMRNKQEGISLKILSMFFLFFQQFPSEFFSGDSGRNFSRDVCRNSNRDFLTISSRQSSMYFLKYLPGISSKKNSNNCTKDSLKKHIQKYFYAISTVFFSKMFFFSGVLQMLIYAFLQKIVNRFLQEYFRENPTRIELKDFLRNFLMNS